MLCKVLNQSRSMQKRQKLLVLFKLQNENNSVTWTGFVSLTWMHRALSCHKHPDFSRVNWFVVINWPSTTTKDKCTQKPLVPACYFFSSFCCCCFFFFNATRLSTEGRLVSRPLWPEFGYYKWANHGPSLESYARSMEWKDSPWLNEAILWKKILLVGAQGALCVLFLFQEKNATARTLCGPIHSSKSLLSQIPWYIVFTPKIWIMIVFDFSWDMKMTQEKSKTSLCNFFLEGEG